MIARIFRRLFPDGLSLRAFTMHVLLVGSFPFIAVILIAILISQIYHHNAMRMMVIDRDQEITSAFATGINLELEKLSDWLSSGVAGSQKVGEMQQNLEKKLQSGSPFDGGLALLIKNSQPINLGIQSDLLNSISPQSIFSNYPYTAQAAPSFLPVDRLEKGRIEILVILPLNEEIYLIGAVDAASLFQNSPLSAAEPVTPFAIIAPDSANPLILYQSGAFLSSELNGTPDPTGAAQVQNSKVSGEEMVIIRQPIPATNWYLVLEDTWGSISDPYLNLTQTAPLILVPMLLFAVFALYFADRQVLHPLQILQQRTNDLATGNFETIQASVGGIQEIRQLRKGMELMAQELKTAQETLRSYIGAITDSTEKERTSLARELHDETLQAQIALGQRIQYELLEPSGSVDRSVLLELQQMIQQNILDLRQLVRGMRPIYLEDLGLATAIEALCTERRAGIQADLTFCAEGLELRLPEEVELAFYRIAQEGTSNALRHAQAADIKVTLAYDQEETTMTITDDGKGFEVPANSLDAVRHGHFGLLDIKERAEIAGAQLEIKSVPGEGTSIKVSYRAATGKQEVIE